MIKIFILVVQMKFLIRKKIINAMLIHKKSLMESSRLKFISDSFIMSGSRQGKFVAKCKRFMLLVDQK